jgi:hypothetical protein
MDLRDALSCVGITATTFAIALPILTRKHFEVLQAHKPEMAAEMAHDLIAQGLMSVYGPVYAFVFGIVAFVALCAVLVAVGWVVEQFRPRLNRA